MKFLFEFERHAGHLQKDCKQPTIKTCYKCKESGHLARDCTKPVEEIEEEKNVSGGGAAGGSDKTCYKCKEQGHLARDCTNVKQQQHLEGDGDRTCYNCGKTGHISRECPESGLNREKQDVCYKYKPSTLNPTDF